MRRELHEARSVNFRESFQDINMARPKTQSKPKKAGHRVKVVKDEEGKELVSVQGHTGMEVPPGKAMQIMEAHVGGMPATRIAKAFNTSFHTVVALIRNRPEMLEKARQTAANNWRTLAAVGTAELLDRVPDMQSHGLVIMSAVATEKMELLSGGATQRVEHVMAPAADQWSDFVSGLKSAQVIDVTPEPVDLPVGSVSAAPQKAAALPAPLIEIETEPLQ
jgi:hypothetical protein